MCERKLKKNFRWRCVWGTHPFPSRTRWLRPRRPMVLYWRRYGRAGGCRIPQSGGVAQLGEHLPCKQGVKGSNPSISIRCGFLKHLCTLKIAYRKRYNIFNTKDTRHPRKIKVCNTNNLKPTFVTLYRRTLVRGAVSGALTK